jgi:hypothetical protein
MRIMIAKSPFWGIVMFLFLSAEFYHKSTFIHRFTPNLRPGINGGRFVNHLQGGFNHFCLIIGKKWTRFTCEDTRD